jgi:hypothetical protein
VLTKLQANPNANEHAITALQPHAKDHPNADNHPGPDNDPGKP